MEYQNVHDIVQLAAIEDARSGQWAQASVKIHQDTKQRVEKILEGSGTTLSAYLRKCCEVLDEEFNRIDELEGESNGRTQEPAA